MTLQLASHIISKKTEIPANFTKTFMGNGIPYKRFFENGTSIIGNASDSMMNSVTGFGMERR